MIQTSYAGKSMLYSTKQKATGEMDAPLRKNEISTVSIILNKY